MTRVPGAQAAWEALSSEGVDICFANPGTTKLDLVRGLEAFGGIRCVVGLKEHVCTGAADGYGRMLTFPDATLLHLGLRQRDRQPPQGAPAAPSRLNGPSMDLKLKHKVAVVTDGSLGIGRAVAEAFVAEGVRVAIGARFGRL